MIGALQALQRQHEPHDLPGEFAAFGISGGLGSGIKKLFMSHPPLEERIAALQSSRPLKGVALLPGTGDQGRFIGEQFAQVIV